MATRLAAFRQMLPRGGTLPQEEWASRHRALLGFLWFNVVALPAYGLLIAHYDLVHSLGHAVPLLFFAVVGGRPSRSRTTPAISVSFGLLTAAAMLVHITGGLIEAHFYFFVIIVALTLYEDWRPFLLAVAYVLVHHGVIGMLAPQAVFNAPGEAAEPWKWAAIHALFVAGAGVAALVAWRLNENVRDRMLAVQQKLEEAVMVDSLTGLANRRRLMADLEGVAAADQAEPTILGMFDLNGFKAYNDAFGHTAGDALLVRLAARLMAAAPFPAQAYRLGGDEFCILSPFDERDSERLGLRCAEALSEQGEAFSVSCSYGWALLPDEVAGAEEALTLADTRMYSHKASGRRSTGRQVGDALVRALQARHPHLGNHLDGVAQLSEAVAARLGIDDEEVEQVRVAAELHDVGKLAIPDAILLKAGALDPGEWDFIKRHTVIGERIVAAAPALAQVARIVRSTHERFDGAGYPDGLAGEAIPLGARIIFACDSYDAMTRPRPYRLETRSRAEAINELRRCAGGQFDPGVVEALVALLEESASRRLVPTPQRRAGTEHRGPVRLIMMPDGQRHVEQLDGSRRNGA